jgi:ferritin-like metal-binding protein YciE
LKLTSLHDLFIDHLKDIHNAEKQVMQALPKMAKAAKSDQVRQAFEQHLEMTKGQVDRLERVFEMMGTSPGRKKCLGMQGLIQETEEFMGEDVDPSVMDAGLIANAQKVEHYEISAYGTVRSYAQMMGHNEAAKLLQQTLDEESRTDEMLTRLAETSANVKAEEKNPDDMGRSRSGSTSRSSR